MNAFQVGTTCALFALLCAACGPETDTPDAFGYFESEAVIVSARAMGQIESLDLMEGELIDAGRQVGLIDTSELHLQKVQTKARIRALAPKKQDAGPELEVLQEQLKNLQREQKRLRALVDSGAATSKQLDDIEGQIELVRAQMEAARAKVRIANRGIMSEAEPLHAQLDLLEDKLKKCRIVNPVRGTVLFKLSEPGEFASPGKPLYKIAPLEVLTLRVYVTGGQLPALELGQEVEVIVDRDAQTNRSLHGTVSWISDEAEFTPKMVQTKEERVNLVYAVKVRVANDGSLKIGMPGEIRWTTSMSDAQKEDERG